ncbi:hypothetical protein [Streptomyces sp. NPDC008125]|uniref:hypothetical protein n=1 Tax=Streptomyces sp. NPDC008125 TaxID=3364811 RepID=UPI0036E384F2
MNHRGWLRGELEAEGYSRIYVSAVASATRDTRLKAATGSSTRAADRVKRAELNGRIFAYTDVALMALRQSHDIGGEEAERTVKSHVKQWAEATEEDERWMAERA